MAASLPIGGVLTYLQDARCSETSKQIGEKEPIISAGDFGKDGLLKPCGLEPCGLDGIL
jgi:hypothetical protein